MDSFSRCDVFRRKLQIWSHLPKKFLIENLFSLYSVSKVEGINPEMYLEPWQSFIMKHFHKSSSSFTDFHKLRARCQSGSQKLWNLAFFGRAHLVLQNKKLYLQISSQIGKTMKKLQCILNTICVHQLTCNILIMFTYLTASNPIYLLVHCQTFMHCLFILYLKLTWI